jgi:voltage-gated potassium channel
MRRRLIIASLVPASLLLLGVLGFRVVEGWPLFDCLYMTVITLTTIGFGEVHPLSTTGRAFTMVLALSGIFSFFFAATEGLRLWASGELKTFLAARRFGKIMQTYRDHVIVCGFGRMGRLVCQEFSAAGIPFVVIEQDARSLEGFDLEHGVPLNGDATSDDVLKHAGVEHARALVTVVASDEENLFITMSARLLNESVQIIARSEEESTGRKLMRAGASRVVSPYIIGGARVAQAVLRPAVLDFVEVATGRDYIELQLEQVRAGRGSPLIGRTLASARAADKLDVIIVAVKRTQGAMTFNPKSDHVIEVGDTLVMLGHRSELDRVEAIATVGAG